MKKNSIFRSLPFKLLVGVIAGVLVGLLLSSTDGNAFSRAILNIVVTLKYILNQIINFCIPLIIIAFIAPSITQMGKNASKLLLIAVTIAYTSSVGAALFSTASGYLLIPHLSISSTADGLKELPAAVFELSIPQIMPVMSALVFSIMIGLAAAWTKAELISNILEEFQKDLVKTVKFRFILHHNGPAQVIKAGERRMVQSLFHALQQRHPLVQGNVQSPLTQQVKKRGEHGYFTFRRV